MTDPSRLDSGVDPGSTGDVELAPRTDPEPLDPARPGPTGPRPRRRVDRGLLLASMAIAGGLVLIIWGFLTAVTGDEGVDRPDAIENLSPVENAIQVLQQESVVVDLQFGYEGVLTIDGIELETTIIGQIEVEPGQQLDLPPTAIFDPGNAVLSFQPTEGAEIESFSAGLHQVKLVYWRTADGPDSARSYVWSFNAV